MTVQKRIERLVKAIRNDGKQIEYVPGKRTITIIYTPNISHSIYLGKNMLGCLELMYFGIEEPLT